MNMQKLTLAGIDYEKGLSHFDGNRTTYESMLNCFMRDDTFLDSKRYLNVDDQPRLIHCIEKTVHDGELLGLTKLTEEAQRFLEALQSPEEVDRPAMRSALSALTYVYVQTLTGIQTAAAN